MVRSVLLITFFISTLLLSAWSERVFVSPDESAAFYFAERFAETGTLSVPFELEAPYRGLLHPRSMVVSGGYLLPASFIGLPILAGALLALFGHAGALLLTPCLALLALFAFRKTIIDAFDDEFLGDMSMFLLMLHPALLYYSGRVMMHNVAFIAFLIFAAYFLIAKPSQYVRTKFYSELRMFECMLAGFLVGMALFMRTAELPWVIGGLVALMVLFRKELTGKKIVGVLLGLGAMLMVIGAVNASLYGSPLMNGYLVQPEGTVSVVTVPSEPTHLPAFLLKLFPFGFHPRAMLEHGIDYGLLLYPWMTIPAIIGLLLVCFKRGEEARPYRIFAATTVVLSLYLLTLYGSWSFTDNPDASLLTIGNSYVRYWLPLFVMGSVLGAYAIVTIYRFIAARLMGKRFVSFIPALALVVMMGGMMGLTARLVFTGHDGILPTRAALNTFISKRHSILSKTEADAIIIVDRADKYLFPSRTVVVPLRSPETYEAIPDMLREHPVYYFGITLPPEDIAYLNDVVLVDRNVKIEHVETLSDESLYRFVKVK